MEKSTGEQIVHDSLFFRKYYTFKGNNKVEYRSYTWDSNIEKYMPHDMFNSNIEQSWEAFKEHMEQHGFIELEEALKIGAKRS